MPVLSSTSLPLGAPAPPFSLPDVTGSPVSLEDLAGAPALVVAFVCDHCQHVRRIANELAAFGQAVQLRGAAMVAINSDDARAFPEDDPAHMLQFAEQHGWSFPYLVDASQEVARAYRVTHIPDFFLFDAQRQLVYHGRFDDSRDGGELPISGDALRHALAAVLAGKTPSPRQEPGTGCPIRWRSGGPATGSPSEKP